MLETKRKRACFRQKAPDLRKNFVTPALFLHTCAWCLCEETCILARLDGSKQLARAIDTDELLCGQDIHFCGCTYTLFAHAR